MANEDLQVIIKAKQLAKHTLIVTSKTIKKLTKKTKQIGEAEQK